MSHRIGHFWASASLRDSLVIDETDHPETTECGSSTTTTFATRFSLQHPGDLPLVVKSVQVEPCARRQVVRQSCIVRMRDDGSAIVGLDTMPVVMAPGQSLDGLLVASVTSQSSSARIDFRLRMIVEGRRSATYSNLVSINQEAPSAARTASAQRTMVLAALMWPL
jgi:hypothetical protein